MPPRPSKRSGGAAQEGVLPMQQEVMPTYPAPRARSDVLVVDGYGITIKVHRGRLTISDGIGLERRERSLLRSSREVRRLVLLGRTGYLTLEAIRWMSDVGIGFCHIDTDGKLIATSAFVGRDDPRLRRAQALAPFTRAGFELASKLVYRKIQGQAQVLSSRQAEGAAVVTGCLGQLEGAESMTDIRRIEAAAAFDYWQHLASTELPFDRVSASRIPEHWRTLGQRGSGLGAGARLATNPGNAIFNYCYALAEVESCLGLSAIGLDPGLGVLHTDQQARASMALDLMEAIRPEVDAWVLGFLKTGTLRSSDFHETRQGHCRILAPLTHVLAETLPIWRRLAAPAAEDVARAFAREAGIRSHTPLTETLRSKSRRHVGRAHATSVDDGRRKPRPTAISAEAPVVAARSLVERCALCGTDLPRASRRKVCDLCLTTSDLLRTEKLRTAGRQALQRMRRSDDDPAQIVAAKQKRAASSKDRMLAIRAWERLNGKVHDWDRYETDVIPVIEAMTVPELVHLTGLSRHYCWQVRAGKKRLHPMHWSRVIDFNLRRVGGR
jgi:CRISPR-associated endonuclease Cas1